MRSLFAPAFAFCVVALASQSEATAVPATPASATASPAAVEPVAQPSTAPSASPPATAPPQSSPSPAVRTSSPPAAKATASSAKPAASPAATSTPKPLTRDAPADRYFGPLKLSALRIRLMIDQLAQRYDRRTIADGDLLHDAGEAETAMWSWLAQYPQDTWGAPTAFHLAQLYADVQTDAARADARRAFAYVAHNYGTSKQGHLARMRLAQGFPPLHEETAVVPTPAASGATVIDASVQASPSAAASTGAAPLAGASGASPSPSMVPAR